jgi:hypothetical protein
MKLSSAANFSLLAFPACLVTTFFVAHANPNNLKGEIKDFQDHRNLRNRKAKEIEIDNSLPTLPPTIEGMDKDNPIMLFSGSTDNSNSTTLKNELTDSSSAVVTAEIIPPDSLDETITLQAIVTNWQSCTIGVDTCADGWRCCVAPEDCWNKKTTCRPADGSQCSFCMDNAVPNWQSCDYGKDICADNFRCCVASEDCLTTKKTTCQNQCTECAFKVDYKSTPDAIKVHSPAPDGTNKCLTLMAGNPPQLSLFTCDWKWYQIFKKFGTNQFQLSNTDLCLTQESLNKEAKVYLSPCSSSYLQQWSYYPVAPVVPYVWVISPYYAASLCLDIPYGNIVDYAELQLWDCNKGNNQLFT